MLIIRRRPGESVMLGDDIEIELLEVCGSQVKLGIRAPQTVAVARREIYVAGRQNRAAAVPIPPQEVEKLLRKFKTLPLKPISGV